MQVMEKWSEGWLMYFDSYATGKRIQHLRKANGMTQEEMAVKLNTSDRHLRNDLLQIFFLQIEFRQLCLVI